MFYISAACNNPSVNFVDTSPCTGEAVKWGTVSLKLLPLLKEPIKTKVAVSGSPKSPFGFLGLARNYGAIEEWFDSGFSQTFPIDAQSIPQRVKGAGKAQL